MSPSQFEFYFDYSSPFAYLGATQVARLTEQFATPCVLRPMLLGALFKEIGTPMVPFMTFPEVKRDYYAGDLKRWAAHWNVPFRFTTLFPMNTVKPLRLTLALMAQNGAETTRLMAAIFKALWVENRDISSLSVLEEILIETQIDTKYLAQLSDQAIKDELKSCTREAIDRGVCGAPTYAVDNMLFWGQDRIGLVEKALQGWRPACG